MDDFILTDKMEYNYFQAFLARLDSLADRERQKKAWRDGDYSNYTDFDEVYMDFSYICEDILKWDLPLAKQALLKSLYKMVEDYSEDFSQKERTEKDVYDDPKWKEIIVFAREVYDNLKQVRYVPDKED